MSWVLVTWTNMVIIPGRRFILGLIVNGTNRRISRIPYVNPGVESNVFQRVSRTRSGIHSGPSSRPHFS